MQQMTLRVPEELVDRVRRAAAGRRVSVNDYVKTVLDAATNPDFAGSEASRLRERLERAGLLVSPGPPRRRPAEDLLRKARTEAGTGTPLSDIVSRDRGE
jgi:hypothetical protein